MPLFNYARYHLLKVVLRVLLESGTVLNNYNNVPIENMYWTIQIALSQKQVDNCVFIIPITNNSNSFSLLQNYER